MCKLKEKIKKFGIFEIIVFAIYIIITIIIAVNHECYEDEAQSWLIARDLNFYEIIQQTKYEGHSFLWYYIIAPFAKMGFTVDAQVYISSIFAIATVYIILKKSPFNKFTKILLVFNGGMIYFYSVISRPYCLIPFLLACISVIYKDKAKHAYLYGFLIALLANTHLIMLPTAVMLTVFFFIDEILIKRKEKSKNEKKKIYSGLLIANIGIMVFLLIAIAAKYNCILISNYDNTKKLDSFMEFLNLIKTICQRTVNYFYGSYSFEVPIYMYIAVGISLFLIVAGSIQNIKQALIFWSQLIFTILIHSLSWKLILPTRVYIVIFTMMFWLWNYKNDDQYKKNGERNVFVELALILLIIISSPSIYKLSYQDITQDVSTGKMVAEYIKENVPKNSCFICDYVELQQSIICYLPKDEYKFYMPNINKYITFVTWDEEWSSNKMGREVVYNAIKKLSNEYENLYIISVSKNIYYENAKEIYSSFDKSIRSLYVRGEEYSIFEVEKNQ